MSPCPEQTLTRALRPKRRSSDVRVGRQDETEQMLKDAAIGRPGWRRDGTALTTSRARTAGQAGTRPAATAPGRADTFERRRHRTGFVVRRAAGDLAPFRALKDAVHAEPPQPGSGRAIGFTFHRKSRTGAFRAAPEAVVEPVGAGPAPSPVEMTASGKAGMKHNLTLVILTPEQIGRARAANGRRKRITHALVCGPYGQMFGTERQCLKYFTLWDPDHRIEVAPGQCRALFADLFDRAVTTTAYAISDYQTTPDLAARLMEASGVAAPAGPTRQRCPIKS